MFCTWVHVNFFSFFSSSKNSSSSATMRPNFLLMKNWIELFNGFTRFMKLNGNTDRLCANLSNFWSFVYSPHQKFCISPLGYKSKSIKRPTKVTKCQNFQKALTQKFLKVSLVGLIDLISNNSFSSN